MSDIWSRLSVRYGAWFWHLSDDGEKGKEKSESPDKRNYSDTG